MKRNTLFYMAAIVIYILMVSVSWGTTWYVNPVSGDDSEQNPSYNDPLRTISEAISRAASSGDVIRLFSGDFAREGFKEVPIQGTRHVFIYVDKSLTIERVSSSFYPQIVGYYNTAAGSDSLDNAYMMLLHASNISVKYISFDGYNFYYQPGGGGYNADSLETYMPHHCTIGITGNGANAKVEGCSFWHMGRSLVSSSEYGNFRHEGIISAHPSSYGSSVSGVQILDNTFYTNKMDTNHSHEIYLTACQNSEISGNIIYNHGVGVPIRFSWGCYNILVEGNTVYGTAEMGYVHDWNSTTMTVSSGIRLINNTFGTSGLYDSSMNNNYQWPFRSSGENSKYSGYISEFTGNTVYSGYSDNNYVQAVSIGDDSLYVAQYDGSVGFLSSRIHRFPNPAGPVYKPCVGESIDGSLCRGDMCVVNNYIITASVAGDGTYRLGYYLQDSGQGDASSVSPAIGASDKVTTLCTSGFTNRFITGITVSGTAKLYMGTVGDWDADLLWESASVDSITAIARNGSTLVFSGYDDSNQSTTIYYGTIAVGPYSLTNMGSTGSNNTYVPAMTYKGNTLITAKVSTNASPQTTTLYEGTAANPFNSSVYGPSSTTKFLSLTGTSQYLFSVVSNTDNDSNKKVFITDTTSSPFEDVLFFSYWGPYDIN